ncbi:SAM-dependent methyltransferase [Nonomuraea rhizosphaerae]|uniref:SAM-dependent methyltransferase n=1 Tax=Nonomuraea rhizosphaerae TaxID=2665663 RepID=UPI0027E331EA|nr:SAM-dependent methyltransferase [Nonomuraea rhizosphaerae]
MDVAPDGIDPTVPNVARMYDYYLDGKDNFTVDRAAADRVLRIHPDAKDAARANRAFLRRAVRHVVDSGVRQVVDLGAGLPTQGNTHEIAPEARVVYVDYDPIVCAHGRALLARGANVDFVEADIRRPGPLLGTLGEIVDLTEPVAFLLTAVLHFVPDRPAFGLVDALRKAGPAGSMLVISHAVDAESHSASPALKVYARATATLRLRTREEIIRFFDGYELAAPGLTFPHDWRPGADAQTVTTIGYAGVGRKP